MTELKLIPNIHRATHRIAMHIAKCPGVSLSQGEAHILAHLHAHGESTIAQLHQALAHKRSTLTGILDRLAQRKFIRRETDPADRRSFRLTLTPAGAKAAAAIHRHLLAMEREILKSTSAADLKIFTDVILRVSGRGYN